MSDERELVHLGDTEIVDGVLVSGREVGPWAQAAIYTGAVIVAVGTVVVGAAVVVARRKGRVEEIRGVIARL